LRNARCGGDGSTKRTRPFDVAAGTCAQHRQGGTRDADSAGPIRTAVASEFIRHESHFARTPGKHCPRGLVVRMRSCGRRNRLRQCGLLGITAAIPRALVADVQCFKTATKRDRSSDPHGHRQPAKSDGKPSRPLASQRVLPAATNTFTEETIVVAEIDLDAVRNARSSKGLATPLQALCLPSNSTSAFCVPPRNLEHKARCCRMRKQPVFCIGDARLGGGDAAAGIEHAALGADHAARLAHAAHE